MKALRKDFWMEIRKSRARFISIFFIVALGVAFFSGIQSSSPNMRASGDEYYDTARLMDVKVVGTMGLTREDVSALLDVEGVREAEGAYSVDVICGEKESQKVLHVESLNETVNQLTVLEGTVPQKSGDVFLDTEFAASQGYHVGDTMQFDQDDSELLLREDFTVCGIGRSPLYISFNRGNTTLGSGEVNGFAYVLPEDFDQEIFTQIYIRAQGSEDLISYTDAYENLINSLSDRLEEISGERCKLRLEGIRAEAKEELDDARKELADARADADKELSDALKKLEDGEAEYEDGKKKYEDGVKELQDAKTEIEDGRRQLADARAELADGRAQIVSAQSQVDAGWEQIPGGQAELDAGWEEVRKNQEEIDAGYAELNAAKEQLASAKQQLADAKAQLDQKQAELDSGREQTAAGWAAVSEGKAAIADARGQIDAAWPQIEDGRAQLAALEQTIAALQEQLAQEQAQPEPSEEILAQLTGQISELTAQLQGAAASLDAQEAALIQQSAQLDEQEAALLQQEAVLAQTEQELEAGQQQINAAREELAVQEQQSAAQLAAAEEEIRVNEQRLADGQLQIDAAKNQLNAGQAEIDASIGQLNSAQAEIDANWAVIADGEREIADNEQKLTDGQKEYEDGEKELEDAKTELEDARKELDDGWKEYEDGKKEADEEIADAQVEIDDAQKEIDDLEEPEWLVTDRNDLPEYSDYGDNAERIKNIGEVFPVIFFLVAALISLTTMTRMVEEQRVQIGTLKALGYGKLAIASKYLCYALLATVGGSVLGVLIGEKLLPYIIIHAYGIMYHNVAESIQLNYELKYALIASVAAVVCTVGATVFSCYRALVETPAGLMRPPSPKEGKRVLAERIPFFWNRLSFSWKSTLRNLFRYKKRLFMTIFGIAGSMGLMLVGFGLFDSIMDVAVRQYEQIQHYDATIICNEDASDKEKEELWNALHANEKLDRCSGIQLTKMSAPRDKSSLSVYVYVPESLENFARDVTLQDRVTKEAWQLTDEGAVICEKTASLLGISRGDTITLEKENEFYEIPVAAVTENYMGHYVYLTPGLYEDTFGEAPDFLSAVFTIKEEYEQEMETIGKEILKYPAALSISYTSSLVGQLERMLSTLSTVIVVLIVSAGMLAFVVLYNLNNINITERKRELATLKVLGFYDGEVSQYVFRENILLTIFGVAAGAFFGVYLHLFVITTVEVDAVMFGRNIKPISFVYSALFTIGFSLFVNMAMHFKLKKIDMVESLKSVE